MDQDLKAELDAARQEIARLEEQSRQQTTRLENAIRELEDGRTALLYMLEDLEQNRRRIEHAHRQWVNALDAVEDPIFLHDTEFRILRANRAYAAKAGMTPEEVVGRLYWEVFPRGEGPMSSCLKALEKTAFVGEEETIQLDSGEFFISRSFPVSDDGIYLESLHIMEDITERKHSEDALRESESKFSSISRSAQDAILLMNEEGRIIFWNDAATRMFGYSMEEAMGQDLHLLLVPPRFLPAFREKWPHFTLTGEGAAVGKIVELAAHRKNGEEFPIELSISAVQLKGRWCAVGILREITERKQAELALQHTNRALKTLGAGNMALVRATTEQEVLDSMCRAIVETGGYRMAWVGYAQQDAEKTIRPVSQQGFGEAYLESLHLTWADSERGQGPTGIAIRNGKTMAFQDILNDPRFIPWREAAKKRGYASSIALPLQLNGTVFGALSIYAAEPNAFDPATIKLLEEMADDLAFGIQTLRTRAERDQIAEENRGNLEQLRKNLEDAILAIATTVEMRDPYTAGHQRRVSNLAVAIAQELGLPKEQLHGLHLAGTVHDLGKVNIPAEILSKPGRLTEIEFMLIKTHPQAGYDILKGIAFPWPIALAVLQHHERLDGSGYPNGLKGEQIIIEARILAVADVVEAMASHRPYRPGLGIDMALVEIEKHREVFYDPDIADACLRLFREKRFEFPD